ncbi:hypothetical protein AVEN_200461-1 [Araneus ventricosus]|uniref:Uncharacterized protein n=1 Tax=Araneus ventricosus TaxID=182803 RepID=A0A4Y2PGV2_ARAVE|nr:hypothetical protein AVEN_200461-1 [Araneus ventricosus]
MFTRRLQIMDCRLLQRPLGGELGKQCGYNAYFNPHSLVVQFELEKIDVLTALIFSLAGHRKSREPLPFSALLGILGTPLHHLQLLLEL